MFQIDPKFRQMGQGARRRRRRLGALRGGAAVLVLVAGAALIRQQTGPWTFLPSSVTALFGQSNGSDLEEQIVQTESEFDIAPVVRGDTFTDIAGDPMIIQGDSGEGDSGTLLTGPSDLSPIRVGAPAPDRLAMVSEDLYLRERRLVAALPSTREEFALFQAERSRERLMTVAAGTEDGGGDTNAGEPSGDLAGDPARMRNSSSIAFTRDAATRRALWQDLILQIRIPSDIAVLLRDNGFDADTAARVALRMTGQLGIKEELPRGALLALRYRMQAGRREVMQLSLYNSGTYVGALAIGGTGQLVTAADPWAEQPLLGQSVEEDLDGDRPQFRLLDVIYSAALRNGVPGPVIGEAIALMAKVHDLDAFAAEGDRMQLLYATNPGPGADAAGRVLYIGVTGPSGDKRCYVVPQKAGGYDCFAPGARIAVGAGRTGMVAPVAGILTTRFSPVVEGAAEGGNLVWQAAQGTPVVAVAAGRISALTPPAQKGGPAELTIEHDDGYASHYSGISDLPPSVARGAEVKAGAVIGRIAAGDAKGDTGLTFRMLKDGKPVDPVPLLSGGNEVLASNAVEMLISRIIHVESGGNAAAKNPLSTATGLGQFIESTWLRMMRSYRPDLVATLERRQLLDLRFEPALSRQMVRHLAQENEAFLRARGHPITPGNLYLAHFLGPMGASQVLGADPAASVGQVMGPAVVAANPFLSNYSVADLRNWAARKMDARAVSAAAAVPETVEVKASPEVESFMAQMNALLAEGQAVDGKG